MNKQILESIKECTCKDYNSKSFARSSGHFSAYRMNDRKVVDADFGSINKQTEKPRIIRFSETCSICDNSMIIGCSFSQGSVTGAGILINAILENLSLGDKTIKDSAIEIKEILENYKAGYKEYQSFIDNIIESRNAKGTALFIRHKSFKLPFKVIDIRGNNKAYCSPVFDIKGETQFIDLDEFVIE